MEPIEHFNNPEHRFLSNFWRSPVPFDGYTVATVEHAYQASKSLDPDVRWALAHAHSPAAAKAFGRRCQLRPDWESVKVSIMKDLLRLKFAPGTELAARLLATYPADLIEGNTWGDREWGVVDGVGRNLLGLLLMEVREELRARAAAMAADRDIFRHEE